MIWNGIKQKVKKTFEMAMAHEQQQQGNHTILFLAFIKTSWPSWNWEETNKKAISNVVRTKPIDQVTMGMWNVLCPIYL